MFRRAASALVLAACVAACGRAAPPPREGPRRIERLRVAALGSPATLDPHRQDDVVSASALSNVYEGLTAFDAEMTVHPALAERWESVDDLVWRFRLREGVRFHDGRPLEAADVVASLERARRLPGSQAAPYLVSVASVSSSGPGLVEVRTRWPCAILLKKLAHVAVLPRDAPAEVTAPVGTGRYRWLGPAAGAEGVELEAFDGHREGPPPARRVSLLAVADNARRRDMLLSGEVDVALQVAPPDVAALEASRACRVLRRTTLSVSYLALRNDRPPFSDRRVRRALSLALDRQAWVEASRLGLGEVRGQLVDPHVVGFDPTLPPPRRDLAAARRLLAEAGHAAGLEVDLEARQGLAVQGLAEQAAEAGIRVRPVGRPWPELMARLSAGRVTMYYGGFLCPTGDASDLLDSALHTPDPARAYGGTNFFGCSSPELDRLVERANASFDPRERLALLQRAMRVVSEEVPLVPLHTPVNAYALRAGLDWRPRLDGFFRAAEVAAGGPGFDASRSGP